MFLSFIQNRIKINRNKQMPNTSSNRNDFIFKRLLAQSTGIAEYTDCISEDG